jgi:hypothetical protein
MFVPAHREAAPHLSCPMSAVIVWPPKFSQKIRRAGTLSKPPPTDVDIEGMQADIAAGKSARGREGRGGIATGGAGVASRTE